MPINWHKPSLVNFTNIFVIVDDSDASIYYEIAENNDIHHRLNQYALIILNN